MTARTLPSVKQMANRMNTGHYNALKAFRDAASLEHSGMTDGAVRGYLTVLRTLRGWDCIEGDAITDRGRALIAAYETKWGIK